MQIQSGLAKSWSPWLRLHGESPVQMRIYDVYYNVLNCISEVYRDSFKINLYDLWVNTSNQNTGR